MDPTISAAASNVFNGLVSAGYKSDFGPSGVPATGAAGLQQSPATLHAFQNNNLISDSITVIEGLKPLQ